MVLSIQYVETLKCHISSDTIDLRVVEFSVANNVINSNGYGHLRLTLMVALGGSYELHPSTDNDQVYKVRLFLSSDGIIEDSFDLQVTLITINETTRLACMYVSSEWR